MNSLLWTLVGKDLQRLRVNWTGFAVLLAMPLCITALVGTVFGPSSRADSVPRIRMAVVDEDEGLLGGLLAGMAGNDRTAEFLDVVTADREAAGTMVRDNQISAVVVIPVGFSDAYFSGDDDIPPIELIKNPAQTFMPAIVEELLRMLADGLSAVSRNLADELPEVVEILDRPGMPNMTRLSELTVRLGDRLQRGDDYLFPPVIGYQEQAVQSAEDDVASRSGFNVFAFVMPGLVAMFLLFTAESAAKELVVERRQKTLMRYRTMRTGLIAFFAAKAVYAVTVVLLAALIMLVGGGLIFGIRWQHPLHTAAVTVGYSVFSVGFGFLMIAVIYRERLIAILSTVVIMLMAFFGGSMLPSNGLPPLIRQYITPWMPNHVFAEAIKRLQFQMEGPWWGTSTLALMSVGVVAIVIAMILFERQLRRGAPE